MKKIVQILALLGVMMYSSASAETNTAGVEDFVKRFYVEVLDREFEADGLVYWSSQLENKTLSATDVANGFIFSDEFSNRNLGYSRFVAVLYKAFFGREADIAGATYWIEQLEQGMTQKKVVDGFLYSIEFKTLAESYGIEVSGASTGSGAEGIEGFVSRFYIEVLGRSADKGGLDYWSEQLRSKLLTGVDVANGFIFSDEFEGKNLDDVSFIEVLYKAFFGRDADAAGQAVWLEKLEQGESRKNVTDGFLYSEEFATLAESYGILAYPRPDVPDTGNQNGFTPQLLASLDGKKLTYITSYYQGNPIRAWVTFSGNELVYCDTEEGCFIPMTFSVEKGVVVVTDNDYFLKKLEIISTISNNQWQMLVTDKNKEESFFITKED